MSGETRLWLWKNGDHFVAYYHLFPRRLDCGDPAVIGEPAGWAILKPSNGDPRDIDATEIMRAENGIRRGWKKAEGSLAGGEQVRSSEAASQPTPAAVDTAKVGERLPDELLATRMSQILSGTSVLFDVAELQAIIAELQSHRAAAGREGVIEECIQAGEKKAKEISIGGLQYLFSPTWAAMEVVRAIRALKKGQS